MVDIKAVLLKDSRYFGILDKSFGDIVLVIMLFLGTGVENIVDAMREGRMGNIMNETGNPFFERSAVYFQEKIDAERMFEAGMGTAGDIRIEIAALVDAFKPLQGRTLDQLQYDRFVDFYLSVKAVGVEHRLIISIKLFPDAGAINKILADFPNAFLSESRNILATGGIDHARSGQLVNLSIFRQSGDFLAFKISDSLMQ